ncbi:hypothetical protein SAMN04487826_1775 [Prevotella sp. khp1]|uniref:hypothetical protein n=1 Tax=Prevotellaceae TaxID=171552 RepID=UPI000880153E|nr:MULTISPECIES: hypothetical protein [Prevotellaceae]QVJ79989.1 hypothetical protein J4031_09760 [Xylanibacter ruminicola]SDQ45373.1 hypothetical protein SAMN04487826_1775 [Prevotella sp. khp1]
MADNIKYGVFPNPLLNDYLKEHHSITLNQLEYGLTITEYRAQKWLDELTAEEFSKYYSRKRGNTYVYYRYGWEK